MSQRVLVLCTGPSGRSQMAAGLINHFLGQKWEAVAASVGPFVATPPLAIQVMAELGIDISRQRAKSVDEVKGQSFDLVIIVCDEVAAKRPVWLGQGQLIHIGFEDPTRTSDQPAEQAKAFRRVRDMMRKSVLLYLEQFSQVAGPPPGEPVQRQTGATPATGKSMRTHYHQELRRLQDELLLMGSMVCQALHDGLTVLKQQDLDHARQVIADDRLINAKRYAIEDACLTLIATQQPMASDMRLIAGILETSSELERIGDYAKGIARITLYIGKEPLIKPLVHMTEMYEIVIEMLRGALDAFVTQNVEQARIIPQRDDAVDTLYNTINRELIDLVMANPKQMDHANYLSWAAHNLERAADRTTNICERIIYTVTGQLVEMDLEEPDLAGVH
jgi:phosphate transport system protein